MSIGQPVPRLDGRVKVTGGAKYAADQQVEGALFLVLIGSPVPAGTIRSIDTHAAEQLPGVVRILTAADMPRLSNITAPAAVKLLPMQDAEIRHQGQPIAIVAAETLEQAEQAARLVAADIAVSEFVPQGAGEAVTPTENLYAPAEFSKGDVEAGLAGAAHRHSADYLQPSRHHNPMEPSAVQAFWRGDELTMFDSTQHGYSVQAVMANAFGIKPEQVRVICPHTGGGFGCKGFVWPHEFLAAAAARVLGQPVKLVLSRAQMYSMVGYQPDMRHRMTVSTDAAGRLSAICHDVEHVTSIAEDFVEHATAASQGTYASQGIRTTQKVKRAHVNLPTAMRAPWEGPGLWGLECAIDEMAHIIGMDPLDFRLANYAETDPASGKPWSSKKLREAYEEGAQLFGWRNRSREPRRDGPWLLGSGMATSSMGCFRFPSVARVRLSVDGRATIETGCHDIGTGTLTIFPQIAADVLGLPVEQVSLSMGDTALPRGGPTYGSSSTMGVGASVLYAARALRAQLAELAGIPRDEAVIDNGVIRQRGGRDPGQSIFDLMRRLNRNEVVADGEFSLPGGAPFNANGEGSDVAISTFGAIFVEVAVDPELGLLRLRRAVGSYSAGRIINPRTARAQMIGGIIWGWGMVAMEGTPYEGALGRWLSQDLAGVAVPVNADTPADIDIHFVDEYDAHASPLGAKGIGELGATGVAAAVASAVFHATGKRVRSLPITPAAIVTV
ncbi:xanthine dehydrogenase family protein molybdopterin-binding subunit [Trinickia sp. LjRoot230]|uniref:xanthine dehydrogenase family protein molybdopterin-binding subunit n=1 Tax=Trinickia sp. LjRoot230 TaxID=3342288 RepID=UPI003ECFBFCB